MAGEVKFQTPKQLKIIEASITKARTLSRMRILGQSLTCGVVGTLTKLFMSRHSLLLHNKARLLNALHNRPKKSVPLITVMNHSSTLDELMLWTTVLRIRDLFSGSFMRWTAVAGDILYINSPRANFFTLGKCIGVWRNIRDRETGKLLYQGQGVYQAGMNFLLDRLADDGWVNLCPQGRVIFGDQMDDENLIQLKWGVGRLVADALQTPMVLPIWHCGFEKINPVRRPYAWHMLVSYLNRQRVTVCIGEPIPVDDLVRLYRSKEMSSGEVRQRITDRIQEQFYQLKDTTEALHTQHLSQSSSTSSSS